MDMTYYLTASEGFHRVSKYISADCLNNILHKLRTVVFNQLPFLILTDSFIGDGF